MACFPATMYGHPECCSWEIVQFLSAVSLRAYEHSHFPIGESQAGGGDTLRPAFRFATQQSGPTRPPTRPNVAAPRGGNVDER